MNKCDAIIALALVDKINNQLDHHTYNINKDNIIIIPTYDIRNITREELKQEVMLDIDDLFDAYLGIGKYSQE